MARLHQILPVERSIVERTKQALQEARGGLARTDWLNGFAKTYQPKDEDGDQLPNESKKVQVDASAVIELVGKNLAALFDITATKEWANTQASSDVVVNGATLVHGAPVSYLLFLEKQLAELKGLVEHLPTLDPAVEWTFDSNTGMWKSDVVGTARKVKVTKPVVLYPATDKHPAQVKEVSEDVLAGTWSLVQFSSALPRTAVEAMLERLGLLRDAVLHAREAANSVEAPQQTPGERILGFVFHGLS